MPLPSFTISQTPKIAEILGNVAGSQLAARPMVNAKITFRCNVSADDLVLWAGDFHRIRTITAYVNTAGSIERKFDDGTVGAVKLVANDSGLNVSNIQWTIEVWVGKELVKRWTFPAQAAGATLNLATVAPVPTSNAVGILQGPAGPPGTGLTGTFRQHKADAAAMIATSTATAVGDWVIRDDTGGTIWVLTALPYSTLGNWEELNYPSTGGSGTAADAPRALSWDEVDGWPPRPDDDRVTFFMGGDAPGDAPTDINLLVGDWWFPTNEDSGGGGGGGGSGGASAVDNSDGTGSFTAGTVADNGDGTGTV